MTFFLRLTQSRLLLADNYNLEETDKMPDNAAIGFDLGGSHFAAGGVSDGTLKTKVIRVPINNEWSQQMILEAMAQVILEVKKQLIQQNYWVIGCGGGAPGPANFDTGVIGETPNMPSMRGCHLSEELGDRTNLLCRINNDANLIVYGEACAGAGKGHETVYGCTLGTGFGQGLVKDGKIHTGRNFKAMEVAKAPIGIDLVPDQTIEAMVSTGGIKNHFYNFTIGSGNPDPLQIEKMALDLKHSFHREAVETYVTFGKWLGFTLSWVQALIAPDIMLIGGNIAKAWPLFEPAMTEFFIKHSWENEPVIKPMILGEEAGIIGGAYLHL